MPAGSEDAGTGVVRLRPFGVRVAAVVVSAVLVVTVVVVWLLLPDDTQDAFTLLQRLTVLAIMAGGGAIAHALARCRVDVDDAGLTVVNGYRTHRFEWNQVVSLTLRRGNPWAVLDLADGTTQAVMGIQGSDGERARAQARRLRALIEEHAGTEPDQR